MTSQSKVALLFLFALLSIVVFVSFIGQFALFGQYKRLTVAYNFVGGLEEGSHVRLMGVKVGKVDKVEFKPDYKTASGEEVKLHIHIKVKEKAWSVIKEDSQFYINMAGIIGEKYLEISPGLSRSKPLKEGSVVRGMDPPRVDQLISQGYALAGKILSVVEDNEGSVTTTIGSISELVTGLNKVLTSVDSMMGDKEARKLLKEVRSLAREMNMLMQDANRGQIKSMIKVMRKLMGKLEKIEEDDIRDFLQVEGIKARVAL
jgi:phospholipid/cholesterol/gamma-HCH transport system substrate-binding protein